MSLSRANSLIRLATAADISQLAGVHVASWRGAYRGILPDEVLEGLTQEQFETRWKFNFFNKERTNLILEVDGRAAGFASVGAYRDAEDASTGEVYALYLHPQFWNGGYGRLLWEEALSLLKPRFMGALVWVLEDNSRARRFYERMGCQLRGQDKMIRLYGVDLPEVCYRIEWTD